MTHEEFSRYFNESTAYFVQLAETRKKEAENKQAAEEFEAFINNLSGLKREMLALYQQLDDTKNDDFLAKEYLDNFANSLHFLVDQTKRTTDPQALLSSVHAFTASVDTHSYSKPLKKSNNLTKAAAMVGGFMGMVKGFIIGAVIGAICVASLAAIPLLWMSLITSVAVVDALAKFAVSITFAGIVGGLIGGVRGARDGAVTGYQVSHDLALQRFGSNILPEQIENLTTSTFKTNTFCSLFKSKPLENAKANTGNSTVSAVGPQDKAVVAARPILASA